MSGIIQRVTFGYTPITNEIRKLILDMVSDEYTLSDIAYDVHLGYRSRTQAMQKVLGTSFPSYKTIRLDIVERLRKLHKEKNNAVEQRIREPNGKK